MSTFKTPNSHSPDSAELPSHTMAAGSRSLIELPRVNLEAILTKSPLSSLLACCCVSKSLLNLIKQDSEFARIHLAKSEPQLMIQSSSIRLIDLDTDAASRVDVKPNLNTPLDGFRITHSCNGLVLLEHTDELDIVHRCMIYNPVTSEYTLLPELIVLLNSETHELGEISGPAHLAKSDALAYTDLVMVVVDNRLSIVDRFTNWLKVSVWVMKDYGVKDSWHRQFVVDTFGWLVHARYCLMPIICRNNGEIVMVSDHGFILIYDMNKKKGRVVNHPPLQREWSGLMHTPSFISLTDVVSGTKLEVVKVAPRLADPE